jgi:putative copper export protein
MSDIVFYLHLAAATSWIGGSMLLFVLGVTIKDKEAQKIVYQYIGPLYGYFESVILFILLSTGIYMGYTRELWLALESDSDFAYALSTKAVLVAFITIATIIHMSISLKSHKRDRTLKEKIVSRTTSLMIFILNLIILWFAIQIRNYL